MKIGGISNSKYSPAVTESHMFTGKKSMSKYRTAVTYALVFYMLFEVFEHTNTSKAYLMHGDHMCTLYFPFVQYR